MRWYGRLLRRFHRSRCGKKRLRRRRHRLRLRHLRQDRRLLRVPRNGISDGSRRVLRRRRCRLRLGMCLTQSQSMIRGSRMPTLNPRSTRRRLRFLRQRQCQSGIRSMSIGRIVADVPHSGSLRKEVMDLRSPMGPEGCPHPRTVRSLMGPVGCPHPRTVRERGLRHMHRTRMSRVRRPLGPPALQM